MIAPGSSMSMPQAQPEGAGAALAALAVARARLLGLSLQAGQSLEARVLRPAANGLVRLELAGQVLQVAMQQPLPIGATLLVQVQNDPTNGQLLLLLRGPPVPAPAAAAGVVSGSLASQSAWHLPLVPPAAPSTSASPLAPAAAAPQAPTVSSSAPGTPALLPPAATAQPARPGPQPVTLAPAPPAPAAPAAIPAVPDLSAATPAPQPAVVSARAGPSPLHPVPPLAGSPASALAPPSAVPASPTPPPDARAAVPAAAAGVPPRPQAAPAASPPTAALSAVGAASIQQAPQFSPSSAISTAAAPPPPAPLPGAPASPGQPMQPLLPPAPAIAVPPPGAARSLLPPLQPSAPLLPPHPAPGSPAGLLLQQATRAAATQDSVAPLLQNLAALHSRIGQFPRPVAEAALRLLAGRLAVDGRGPGAAALRQAVLGSGVFAAMAGRPVSAGDMRTSLLQLRSALGNFLGAEIAPVAPVSRRPPPPTRGAQPRSQPAEPASLPQVTTGREAGKVLLHQAEAALSRLRLLQLASQPQEAARTAAPPVDCALEVPMLLGQELAVAQLRISRDAPDRGSSEERAWQMRFSVTFSVLGEVGAQVTVEARRTSILLWAEAPETAAVLEELLPELAPALAARGLEPAMLRVQHGAPGAPQPRSGQLVDSLR